MGDAEFVADLLETFTTDAPAMMSQIDSAIGNADAGTVRRIAHTLKSNSATFGALALSEACRELEHVAKEGHLDGAPAWRKRSAPNTSAYASNSAPRRQA